MSTRFSVVTADACPPIRLLPLAERGIQRMRKSLLLGFSILLLCVSCGTARASKHADRVLFVGNSLTYVGNLPAVFSALARANGHTDRSFMLVAPGATLSERVADGSAVRALQKCGCNVLVLQERGGDLFGLFGKDALARSKRAVATLAADGRAKRATVVLLGTYNSPKVSHRLVAMEGAAAHAAGIPYLAVSERLWRLHEAFPSLEWLRKEGGHPGKALTLLDAILLYEQVYGAYPAAKAFVVHAPIYGTHSGLTPQLRPASAPPPSASTPRTVSYPAAAIERLVAALEPH